MAAANALIQMTAQRRGAATNDGIEAPCDAAMQGATAAVPRNCCPFGGRRRPPRGWAGSSLHPSPGVHYFVRPRHFDRFERAWNHLQVASGQVQIDGRVFELGVSEKHLDGAQIGACFEHMRGETVPAIYHAK